MKRHFIFKFGLVLFSALQFAACDGIKKDWLYRTWQDQKSNFQSPPDSFFFSVTPGDTLDDLLISVQDSILPEMTLWFYRTTSQSGVVSIQTREMTEPVSNYYNQNLALCFRRMNEARDYLNSNELYYAEKRAHFLRLGFSEERDLIVSRSPEFSLSEFKTGYQQNELEFEPGVFLFYRRPSIYDLPEE